MLTSTALFVFMMVPAFSMLILSLLVALFERKTA